MCGFHAEMGCRQPKGIFQQFLDVENKWLVDYHKSKGVYDGSENARNDLRAEDKKTQEKEIDL